MDCNILVIIFTLYLSGESLQKVRGDEVPIARTIRDSESRSRSIKTSLDQVLREVKLKLKNIFSSPNVKIEKESRFIKTPIEAILPQSWFIDEHHDFYQLHDIPRDVEIQIEDLNRRWERGNVIADIDRESFMKPRKTRVRKTQKLKTKFLDKRNQTSYKPESKIYFTQIIKDRAVEVNDRKVQSKRKKQNSQEINDTTDMLDSYSPYIYAELLKENKTNFVLIEDLTDNNINATESVIVNEIDLYENTDITETTESDIEANMVTLEVAVVDSFDLQEQESNGTDDFLPFIPPSAGIDFETEYELTMIGEDRGNESGELGDQTPFSREEHGHSVSLRAESWAFTAIIVSSVLLCLLILYEVSVLFSLFTPLSLSSHCLVMSLMVSTIAAMLLTLSPSPLLCAATRLLAPLSYTAIFSCLLLKFTFLTILSREQVLSRGYQVTLLIILILVQVSVSAYLLVTSPPKVRLTEVGELQLLQCQLTFEERLPGHLYSVLVLALTVTLWLRFPDIRNLFAEAQGVGITALLSGPVWLAWVVAGLSLDTR